MTPLTGWEVLSQLKACESTSHIPVILMSLIEQRQVAGLLGVDDYLVKPVQREALEPSGVGHRDDKQDVGDRGVGRHPFMAVEEPCVAVLVSGWLLTVVW